MEQQGFWSRSKASTRLPHALERFELMSFDPHAIRRHAERFSKSSFMQAFENIVYSAHEQSAFYWQFPNAPLAVRAGV